MEMTTTTVALNAPSNASLLGLVAIVTLIILLISREMSLGLRTTREARWGQALKVGILPLTITFFVIVVVRLSSALS